MFLAIVAGLISSRVVLSALGEIDYGVNSLVAGLIGMLAFLQSTISTSSIRFIAYGIGKDDPEYVQKTFKASVFLHFSFAFVIVIFIEIIGLFMLDQVLNIPSARLRDATIVFHITVLTTFVAITSVPYDAMMNAYEDFFAFSVIDTLSLLFGLLIAFSLIIFENNRLILYSAFTAINFVITRAVKQYYCQRKYAASNLATKSTIDWKTVKEMLAFAGWKTLDAGASVFYYQLRGIIMNIFFGVSLNASNGIAVNFTSQINNFSSNLTTAVNPQLIKSEGEGNRFKVLELTKMSAKFSLFLFALFSFPIIAEADYILKLWLINPPPFSALFIRLILLEMLLQKLTHPLTTSLQAVGKIKGITVIVTLNLIIQVVISYFLYSMGFPPSTIYMVAIIGTIGISTTSRIYFGKVLLKLSVRDYFSSVFIKGLTPLLIAMLVNFVTLNLVEESFSRMLLSFILITITLIISIRYFGLSEFEYSRIKTIINFYLKRKN